MSLLYLFLLAAVQGITEFLPISSSAHLIMIPRLLAVADQGRLIDVAVHVGTLGAVVVYFHRDVRTIGTGLWSVGRGALVFLRLAGKPMARYCQPQQDHSQRMALAIVVATIPIMVAGLLAQITGVADAVRRIDVIAWATLGFALLLYISDTIAKNHKTTGNFGWRDGLLIGMVQVFALIPGASRAGVCITAARALGYHRAGAAKLAMLLSIPTIMASGVLSVVSAMPVVTPAFLIDAAFAAVCAFVMALPALALMIRFVPVVRFVPYVVYRLGLGIFLLIVAYG